MSNVVETLRPTASFSEGNGSVNSPAAAYDDNLATSSTIIAANSYDYEAQRFTGFPADHFPATRTEVLLLVDLSRQLWDTIDVAYVFFKPTAGSAWSLVAEYTIADIGTGRTAKSINITTIAGSYPATGFQAKVGFSNDGLDA